MTRILVLCLCPDCARQLKQKEFKTKYQMKFCGPSPCQKGISTVLVRNISFPIRKLFFTDLEICVFFKSFVLKRSISDRIPFVQFLEQE